MARPPSCPMRPLPRSPPWRDRIIAIGPELGACCAETVLDGKSTDAVGPSQKQSQTDLSLTAAPVHQVLKINCSAVDLVESISQYPSTIVWA
jgi:hypothetical protein